MSKSSQSVHQQSEQADSFEDRVAMLFEELAFAIQWDRPSILLIPYRSEYIRAAAGSALEKRLAEIKQQVVHLSVNEKEFDIPLLLSQRPERAHVVYSITSISRGGGKKDANAYRALNIRRELFVDHKIKVLFWLTPDEATELSRHSPDFWAFRHRVIEFDEDAPLEYPAISTDELSESDRGSASQAEELAGQINKVTKLLKETRNSHGAAEARLDLLSKLAKLNQVSGELDRSSKILKQGIELAQSLNDNALLARFWEELGLIHQYSNKPIGAVRAIRKAIRLAPQNTSGWISLGLVYRLGKRLSDAIIAYRQAIKIDPQNFSAQLSLIACYRLLGKDELAEKQIKLARLILENENEYNKGTFESVCGNADKAIQMLAIALEKKQIGLNTLQRDPNLDFIRHDPRFQRLIELHDPILYGPAETNQ